MSRIGIGVDLGHGSIKVVQMVRNREQLQLTGYSKILIPVDSVTGSLIQNQAVISEAIRHACSKAHLTQKKVVMAVAGDAVIIKHLNLPIMIGPQLGEVIKFEVEKFLPFSITEAVYDWDILCQHRDSGEMELMVVAAQNKVIASQVECIKKAGLQPVVVDAQPFAILRSLGIGIEQSEESPKGVAVLDIGSAMTQMIIFYEGGLRVTRIISTAGNSITEIIARKLHISPEKAEAIKCNLGDADYNFADSDSNSDSYLANQVIKEKLEELIVEIRGSLEYFGLQFHGAAISELILTGGSSKLRNLSRYLQRELALTVGLADPLANIQLNMKQIDRAVLLGNPFQFSVAIGLALRGVE